MKILKKMKSKKGFTLIELIVVMAVIGILVLLAAPKFLGYTKDAQVSAMKADAKMLSNVGLVYNIENEGAFPIQTRVAGTDNKLGTGDDVLSAPVKIAAGVHTALEAAVPSTDFYAIDYHAIKSNIKSMKNVEAEYVMDADGNVYHTKGVTDREGNVHFNESKVVKKVVTP